LKMDIWISIISYFCWLRGQHSFQILFVKEQGQDMVNGVPPWLWGSNSFRYIFWSRFFCSSWLSVFKQSMGILMSINCAVILDNFYLLRIS
jgi:hypothetical protein